MRRLFLQLFVYTDLFIAFCALMMAWEAMYLFDVYPSTRLLLSIFFATISGYSLHSLINLIYPPTSERHRWSKRHQKVLVLIFVCASLACILTALPFLERPLPFLLGGLLTFFYSAPNLPGIIGKNLRRMAAGKTVYLAAVWTYATTILPIWILEGVPAAALNKVTGYRFFLIYAICILFDLRDKETDAEKGVQSLPTLVPEPVAILVYFASLSAALICLFLPSGMVLIRLWPLLLPIFLLIPMFFLARRHPSDGVYYILLDGMMALSAFLHAILFG